MKYVISSYVMLIIIHYVCIVHNGVSYHNIVM